MSFSSADFLPAEYQAALARLQRIQDGLPLAGAVGLLVSLGAAAYALGHRAALNAGYAWAAPFPFLAATCVVLVLLAQRAAALHHLEELRQQAGNLPAQPASPYTGFLLRLLVIPIGGAAVLYGLTLFVCWRALHTGSPISATLFGLTYFGLTLATALLGWAVWSQAKALAPLTVGRVRQVLLPYPGELITGLGLVTAGWLAAWLTAGWNISQLRLLDTIVQRNGNTELEIPLAAVAALGLLVFLVNEGLLVPAGLLWRDLRMRRSSGLPDSGEIKFGYAQVLARVLLALPFAFWLGGMPGLTLALLIWLQLAAAALLTQVAGAETTPQRTRFHLLWGALLYPLRFFSGALVWVGPHWSFSVLLLLFCAVGFLALGFSAARQARLARLQSPAQFADPETDPRLAYALHSAPRWQRAGFLAAGFTALVLVLFQALAESPAFFNELLAKSYGFRTAGGPVAYHQAGLVNSLLLVFDLLILGLLACAGIVRLLGRSKAGWVLLAERMRPAGIPLFGIAAIVLFVAAFPTGLTSLALGGLLCFVPAASLWAER